MARKKIVTKKISILPIVLLVIAILVSFVFLIIVFNKSKSSVVDYEALGLLGEHYSVGEEIVGFTINYPDGWYASVNEFSSDTENGDPIESFHVYSQNPEMGSWTWSAFAIYIYKPYEDIDSWFEDFLSQPKNSNLSKTEFNTRETKIGNRAAYYIEEKEASLIDPRYVVIGESYTYEILLGYPPEKAEVVKSFIFPHIVFR